MLRSINIHERHEKIDGDIGFKEEYYKMPCLMCIRKVHKTRMLNYLKETGMCLSFPVNFGRYSKAAVERIVL